VCADELSKTLDLYRIRGASSRVTQRPIVLAGFGLQPIPRAPAPGPSPDKAIRLLVELTRRSPASFDGATAKVVAITNVTIPIVGRNRRVGDYVYGIVDGTNVLDAAVIPGDPFQQRGYGGVSAPHQTVDGGLTTRVTVIIPHVSRADLATRSIGIHFYRLEPLFGRMSDDKPAAVNRETIQAFIADRRKKLAEVTATDLKLASSTYP
jgi:hypothetical protein